MLIVTGEKTSAFTGDNEHLAASLPLVQRPELPGDHGAPSTARDEFVSELRTFLARHR